MADRSASTVTLKGTVKVSQVGGGNPSERLVEVGDWWKWGIGGSPSVWTQVDGGCPSVWTQVGVGTLVWTWVGGGNPSV